MVTIIIGDYGTGKTTLLKKKFLSHTKRNKKIIAPVPEDFPNMKVETDFEAYMKDAVKLTNTFFVVDEAVTCIPMKQPDASSNDHNKRVLTWLVNARKFNNAIFFVYHDFNETPLWIFRKADFVLRFQTNDQLDIQKRRFITFPKIVRSFEAEQQPTGWGVYDEIIPR